LGVGEDFGVGDDLGVGEDFGVGEGFGDKVAEGVGEDFGEGEDFSAGGDAGFFDGVDDGFGDGEGDGAAATLQSGRQSARLKTNERNFIRRRPRFPAPTLADGLRVAKNFRMSDHRHAGITNLA